MMMPIISFTFLIGLVPYSPAMAGVLFFCAVAYILHKSWE